jgi:hypothetical protein
MLVREQVIKVRIGWNLEYVREATPGWVRELGPMLMFIGRRKVRAQLVPRLFQSHDLEEQQALD